RCSHSSVVHLFCCRTHNPEPDRNHRKLAICSIICGLSCIGCKALVYSVKAEEATDPQRAAEFSQRAKRFGIIAILSWVTLLVSIPILMALISRQQAQANTKT
uniref:Si:dkey-16l2.20 n=1 Tax=Takifugu rubripes TaxID=31033 RepID=A0A3B5KDU8_TAKRU